MNIYEIICRWHSGHSISAIAKTLTLDRKTYPLVLGCNSMIEIGQEPYKKNKIITVWTYKSP